MLLLLLLFSLAGALLAFVSYKRLNEEKPSTWWFFSGVLGVVIFFYPPIVIALINGVASLFNSNIFQVPQFDFTTMFIPTPFSILALALAAVFFWKLHRDAKRNGKTLYEWVMEHKPTEKQMNSGDDPVDNLYRSATNAQRAKEEKRSKSPDQSDQTP